MEVGSKLPFEESLINFDFRHGLRTFHVLLPFVQNSFSWPFLAMLSHTVDGFIFVRTNFRGLNLNDSSWGSKIVAIIFPSYFTQNIAIFWVLELVDWTLHENWYPTKIKQSEWKLVVSFHMKNYRSNFTFVTVDPLLNALLSFVTNGFRAFPFFRLKSYRSRLKPKK